MSTKNSVIGKARLSNKPNFNAFDLTHRNLFTSSLGQILPVSCEEMLPNEKASFNNQWFTRAQPLVSDSFGRLVENVQSFFVPYSSLWRFASQTMLSTTAQNAQGLLESRSALDAISVAAKGTKLPYVALSDIYAYLLTFESFLYNIAQKADRSGASSIESLPQSLLSCDLTLRSIGIAKLLQYLGYGDFSLILDPNNRDTSKVISVQQMTEGTTEIVRTIKLYPLSSSAYANLSTYVSELHDYSDISVCVFRLLAYQKLFNDFYRLDTWQQYSALACNIDYVLPSDPYLFSSKYINITDFYKRCMLFVQDLDGASDVANIIKVWETQLANYAETKLYSNAVDGVNMFDLRLSNLELDAVNGVLPLPQYGSAASVSVSVDGAQGQFSISALRSAQALQKFKEISASNDSSYSKQILAHFGIEPKDDAFKTYFVGGTSSVMQIDTQVNTNLADDNQAIRGGLGNAQGSYDCTFTSDTYGVAFTLYRMYPIVDYSPMGLSNKVVTIDVDSLPIPEMDSVGMEQRCVFNVLGVNPDKQHTGFNTYGYAARYFDYKLGKDTYHGDLCYTLKQKVLATNTLMGNLTNDNLIKSMNVVLQVSPYMLDNVMLNTRHSLLSDDQFYTNFNCGISMLRPLSVHGLPFAN